MKAKEGVGKALCDAGLGISVDSIKYIQRINGNYYVFTKTPSERITISRNDELIRLYSIFVNGPSDRNTECDETHGEVPANGFAVKNPHAKTADDQPAADLGQKAADVNSSGQAHPDGMT